MPSDDPAPKSLIINSPFFAPSRHWIYTEEANPPELVEGRRKAGYMISDPQAKPWHDKGKFVELPRVNQIRQRVDAWRETGYPGITGITKVLLEHWKDREQREFAFFFCQIEAIETLIWLIESSDREQAGIDIPADGGTFGRLCSKLATGTGKTVVMAMLIAWQVINRVTYPRDGRFSRHIFVVAPNLTIRERLEVLKPTAEGNYYDQFGIVPLSLKEKLWQAKIVIRNWHALKWDTEEQIGKKKGVDKRGVKSDEAYTREVLGAMADAHNWIVINDEAHHAWRVPAGSKIKGVGKEEVEEATKWIGGLERLHKVRNILNCFDFSATPFAPSGKKTAKETLFGWVVSDFGLNDAIESGLVKTPRIVVRDDALPDAKTLKPRLYHIYSDPEVRDDLNRSAESHEPLPSLIMNAYALLGADWEQTRAHWQGQGTPPVMITVANRTETAARIKYAFDNGNIPVGESLRSREGILHIDSKVLKAAEETQEARPSAAFPLVGAGKDETKHKTTREQQAEGLRMRVNTVGQENKPGAPIRNVISVGMLSEGWDARTVTHIMGLRAFTSQLLCEQVVGRGLRRASYEINEETGLFDPEYVNVFGVPFSFLPHEKESTGEPLPADNKVTVRVMDERVKCSIKWPNVIRISRSYAASLSMDWGQVEPLELDTSNTMQIVELAPTVDNKPDVSKIKDIDLEKLAVKWRRQTMIFKMAQETWREMKPDWKASESVLIAKLIRLTEEFIGSDRIRISPALYDQDQKRRQLVITLNMSQVIRHFWNAIVFDNTEKRSPVLDSNYPFRSTDDMRPWRTGKPFTATKKNHINYCVHDSTWEASASFELDRNKAVDAWAKNDHLGFDVLYVYNGVVRKYRPDLLVRLQSGDLLVLEIKGQQTEQDDEKHKYMQEWVEAVNEDGGFGRWHFAVSRAPSGIKDILAVHAAHT